MNRSGRFPRAPFWRAAAAFLAFLLCAGAASAQILNLSAEPVPTPDGDTSFVGRVEVTFAELGATQRGRIYYTTNGTTPNANSKEYDYDEPIVITATTTLKARRLRSLDWSATHTSQFTKRKLPTPKITFDGTASFAGSKKVTLAVPSITPALSTAPKIFYSTDASRPDSAYPSNGLTISKTCVLKVFATHADYDTSLVASVSFTLLEQVATPVLSPADGVFQGKTLTVSFPSSTQGAFYQWSIGANSNPDTATPTNLNYTVLAGNIPGEEIVLRVIAKRTTPPAANSVMAEGRYIYQPHPDAPTASRTPGPFYDSVTVALQSPAGTVIHYTVDGLAVPTRNTPEYDPDKKLHFDSTVTLKAAAFNELDNSEAFVGTYTLNLSPPDAGQPSQEFVDSIKVTLTAKSRTAKILYTLDKTNPTLVSTQYDPRNPLVFRSDATIKAIAVKGSVVSQVATYTYLQKNVIKTTATPTITPLSRDFKDPLPVTISAEAGAEITYSLDGIAYFQYTGPLTLTSTTVLRVTAKKGDLAASATRTETYVLVPSPPVADPAEGSFPNRVTVALSPKTSGSQVLYSLEPGNFVPELALAYTTPLVFSAGTAQTKHTVQAAAVLGNGEFKRISDVVTFSYTVFPSSPSDSLLPGQQRDLSQGVALVNQGNAPVLAKLGSVDQFSLVGFRDATHYVTLTPTAGRSTISAAFTRSAGRSQAIYRIDAKNRFEHVGAGTTVSVSRPGTYLAAVDVEAPTLAFQGQDIKDSTLVMLTLRDNTINPTCMVTGSGLAQGGVTLAPDTNGTVKFPLKNTSDTLKNLWFRAVASDPVNQVAFPATGNVYCVPLEKSNLPSPTNWKLGKADQPYDLVGIPAGSAQRLTWKQIRDANPDANLTAHMYHDDYTPLLDNTILKPGMAFWLGSLNSGITSIKLAKFQSQGSDPEGRFHLALKFGWNLITNPSLDVLYWPMPMGAPNYGDFKVREPWAYSHAISDYVRTDTLVPWRGYFVYSSDSLDRVVELRSTPFTLPKVAAGREPDRLEIELDYGRPATIRLGARSFAKDGVGTEDEPVLPAAYSPQAGRRPREGWSARDGGRLMTDLLRLSGEVLRWKVVLVGAPAPGRDSLVKVKGSILPAGYEAWAWSHRRNLKVRLETGAAYSLPGYEPDTLLVLTGPAAKLAGLPELAHAVEKVAAFSSRTANGRNGPLLLLALPTDAVVEAGLWSASGRRLAVIHSGRLGSGEHALPISGPQAARNFAVVRITAKGPGWREVRTHRLAP